MAHPGEQPMAQTQEERKETGKMIMSNLQKLSPMIIPTGSDGWILPCCTLIFACMLLMWLADLINLGG